jgi:hypothetical protein
MEVAAVAEQGTVAQAPAGGELGPVAGVTVEVAAEPRLAFRQEVADPRLRMRPPAAGRERHGHDHAPVGMEDDAEAA